MLFRSSGFCTVTYDVNATGQVYNPEIKKCQPAGVFDRSALKAIMAFKYTSRIVDGVAVGTKGMEYRFEFGAP